MEIKNLNIFGNNNIPAETRKKKLHKKTISALGDHQRKIQEKEFNGIFISIGEMPSNELAKMISVNLDKNGYIVTDKRQGTNVPRVYSAGDITGGVKQVIVACAEGAIAANSAYEDIKNPYWVGKESEANG